MRHAPLPQRLTGIGIAVAAMVGAIVTMQSLLAGRTGAATAVPRVEIAAVPIAAEAAVFVGYAAAAADTVPRRAGAHARTLATYRALRAYPGAPPRVPHGLTSAELRAQRCNTCHERGGWVARFEAYAPVTPHPALAACLQCHVMDAALVGIALPAGGPDAVCRQCHAAGRGEPMPAPSTWTAASWPVLAEPGTGLPPVVPHDLDQRGNCRACHAGPGAVAEIRTSHPERTDCRQCHLTTDDGAPRFTRPTAPRLATGGTP